jgi:hypothetical protein
MSRESDTEFVEDLLPDVSGKEVVVLLTGRPGESHVLQDATFERQGGRLYLVGTHSEVSG